MGIVSPSRLSNIFNGNPYNNTIGKLSRFILTFVIVHDWIRIQKVLMYLAILAGINNTIILAVAILAVQFKKFENKVRYSWMDEEGIIKLLK